MAKLIKDFNNVWVEDGKVSIPNHWTGVGWALLPVDWLYWGALCREKLEKVVFVGERSFRILWADSGKLIHSNLYVVQANNRRWPIWWVLCRLWLFARWFERNLRLTAAVWGLLPHEFGCWPSWRDFILLKVCRKILGGIGDG